MGEFVNVRFFLQICDKTKPCTCPDSPHKSKSIYHSQTLNPNPSLKPEFTRHLSKKNQTSPSSRHHESQRCWRSTLAPGVVFGTGCRDLLGEKWEARKPYWHDFKSSNVCFTWQGSDWEVVLPGAGAVVRRAVGVTPLGRRPYTARELGHGFHPPSPSCGWPGLSQTGRGYKSQPVPPPSQSYWLDGHCKESETKANHPLKLKKVGDALLFGRSLQSAVGVLVFGGDKPDGRKYRLGNGDSGPVGGAREIIRPRPRGRRICTVAIPPLASGPAGL